MGPQGFSFNGLEILSLVGLAQCVLILVYMIFRSGKLSRAGLPILYFLILGTAFFLDLGEQFISGLSPFYDAARWFFWLAGAPVSVLVMIQIAQITRVPEPKYFLILLALPLVIIFSFLMASISRECSLPDSCEVLESWVILFGLITGAASLLAVWIKWDLLQTVRQQRTMGKERYWLILSMIVVNVLLLSSVLGSAGTTLVDESIGVLVRTILGLGFVYLATTSLFRIYPQSVRVLGGDKAEELTDSELELALKIERLLDLDKIYHEAAYSRADLAKELQTSETILSRVINVHFQKSLPQLFNEHRVEDAKRLLKQTEASIKTISEEVGFNSLASFNRVFRDLAGMTPSTYRRDGAVPEARSPQSGELGNS